MNFEICTDSLEGALAADKYGAKRIELCTALSVGGLTPNLGLIRRCVEKSNIEVHVMIRHKEGDFNYNVDDVEIMKIDIEFARKVGAHGVVFGILNKYDEVSYLNKELVDLSRSLGLEITFHRAFDFVPDYKVAIEKIIEFGFDRLLTSGLQLTAEEGIDIIRSLQSNYSDKIEIMAGSGINVSNVLKIAATGIKNLHFTARKPSDNIIKLSMGELMIVDEDKIKNIMDKFS
ncbi:MAG: copper homeostasis protein CutC [Flavobacteriaceae bacterium]|nr:copper homeostasis protein CutC [Flavobacteriaceae bacterium]